MCWGKVSAPLYYLKAAGLSDEGVRCPYLKAQDGLGDDGGKCPCLKAHGRPSNDRVNPCLKAQDKPSNDGMNQCLKARCRPCLKAQG
ncbi:hypothetical protein CEXT_365491 [Caerostris extrusa]|uniref:Uncharacterized protein n=1 Tax=Caerostris extrusa TaxID=172846 RepID=A0AAV4N9E7_CAEEX|nr:hypothetical protein CEXT_365491 [Caerostris extrusa]